MKGYEHANSMALDLWEVTYPDALHLALTDTFSSDAFYKVSGAHLPHVYRVIDANAEQDFVKDKARADRWVGLRQDSGDPMIFAPRAKEVYESLGIDYRQKTIIYSDGVDVEQALKLQKHCTEIGFKCPRAHFLIYAC